MDEKQLDVFWNVKCPKCGKDIDLEILINHLSVNPALKMKIKK